ncbi:hypothetical protein OAL47_02525 [Verrucomicrobia bacterium]|nr:hypothetical protein [Verrucomicrobiota bacterium]
MKRICILTGSELRHIFVRKFLASQLGIEVCFYICEGLEKSLNTYVSEDSSSSIGRQHVEARDQSEYDFFSLFDKTLLDYSNPIAIKNASKTLRFT